MGELTTIIVNSSSLKLSMKSEKKKQKKAAKNISNLIRLIGMRKNLEIAEKASGIK